ncbi:MAG: hypothetical protein K0R65_675 [Crocinitomicaceae bacterium]|jgi:hypothetical protein|nr:hypothetical protein [Crocinitomicaceae bacterium]
MGKKLILFFCLTGFSALAQEESLIRAGLIKATLTISPSKSLSSPNSYFYLHGILEGYLSESVSVSGEGYFYQGMIKGNKSEFAYNHSLFFGLSRHFTKNNLDFYIGMQPGVSFTQLASDSLILKAKTSVNPSVSAIAGLNYFVGKYIHFFIQSRLVLAEHQTDLPRNISDLRFSAGLGFNINALKSK